jgi:hypothetical protein
MLVISLFLLSLPPYFRRLSHLAGATLATILCQGNVFKATYVGLRVVLGTMTTVKTCQRENDNRHLETHTAHTAVQRPANVTI